MTQAKNFYCVICGKTYFIFVIFFSSCIFARAQVPFEKLYKNTGLAVDILQQNNSGYILIGNTFDYPNTDIFWIQIDSIGNVQSSQLIGTDAFLLKVDSLGNFMWAKKYFNSLNGEEGQFVLQTIDGGFLLGGHAYGSSNNLDALLMKTDSVGNILWQKLYGDSLEDGANNILQINDSSYLICGYHIGLGSSGDSSDFLLMKINFVGDTLWTKSYGFSTNDFPVGLLKNNFGAYNILGNSTGPNLYYIQVDSLGNSNCNDYNPNIIIATSSLL